MIPISPKLKDLMRRYRCGEPLPQEYVDLHAKLAEADLAAKNWHIIADEGMVSDGWMDKMRVRQVVIDMGNGRISRLRWHESGAWFVQGHGWSRAFEMSDYTMALAESLVSATEAVDGNAHGAVPLDI